MHVHYLSETKLTDLINSVNRGISSSWNSQKGVEMFYLYYIAQHIQHSDSIGNLYAYVSTACQHW